MFINNIAVFLFCGFVCFIASAQEVEDVSEQTPDPSDPTRIDARIGAGYKYTDFTGGASINEIRAKVALILGKSGMFVADVGVGKLNDNPNGEDESGLTDGRYRYFHLGPMDLKKMGYRGWGVSAELQTQGAIEGTDGSNLIAVGGIWSFATSKTLSIFPNLIGSAVWSKNFDNYLGAVVRGDLFITWKPVGIWRGGYLKFKPSYSIGVSNDIKGDDSANLEVAVGGMISSNKKWWWDIQGRAFATDELEQDLQGSINADKSVFASITYFM
jgi:hypothetical protein